MKLLRNSRWCVPVLMVSVLLGTVGCSVTPSDDVPVTESRARLFDGMGSHTRRITTTSNEAQRYFDQGLTWMFAFNHDEAIRSFEEAARLDPSSAMPWWGISLANGPHINNPVMPEERSKAAWEALQRAESLSANATASEKALIDALAKQYAWPAPTDRAALDRAYAEAMREVWRANPADDDIGVLFAESMMDLRPWDLWTKDGQAQPGTDEIIATIEDVLRINPAHPGANHLYIHAIEASPNPARADAAADRLRTLVPGSGHLVHMPAHIDIRRGRWQLAGAANENAIKADAVYRKLSPTQGFYRLYMAHNYHFLAFGSMMEGRRDVALKAAREMIAGVPPAFLNSGAAIVDPVMSIEYDVMKRFGMWDEILGAAAPDERLPITTAMWRFTRGIAHAAKGQVAEAMREQEAFKAAVKNVPENAIMMINPAHTVLAIADHMLAGEIALRRGESGSIDESITELRKAVVIEDGLMYMEPPDWIQPVRHTLGAVLVSEGRYAEAEAVYREDLKRWPENGWSLLGLKQCLEARGATTEANDVAARLSKAWARSQVKATTTCLCVKAKK